MTRHAAPKTRRAERCGFSGSPPVVIKYHPPTQETEAACGREEESEGGIQEDRVLCELDGDSECKSWVSVSVGTTLAVLAGRENDAE